MFASSPLRPLSPCGPRSPGSPFSPFLIGGGQENGKRAGTEAVAQIVGLGKATELAQQRISSNGTEKLASLRNRLEKNIFEKIEGVHHNGCKKRRLPNTSHLSFENVDANLKISLDNEIRKVELIKHT